MKRQRALQPVRHNSGGKVTEIAQIGTWSEALPYLDMLKGTVAGDVRPLLATPGSAPFAVFREVMSYIDHLGHLFSGRDKVGDRFQSVMRLLFAKIDPNYGAHASEIYQMYRCGPVHEFQPKKLENDRGERLFWLSYRGSRNHQVIKFRAKPDTVSHLEPLRDPGSQIAWLPVSSDCLVDDLERAIADFKARTDQAEAVTAWNRAARQLVPPYPFNFVL
jgi:hypothetical protein